MGGLLLGLLVLLLGALTMAACGLAVASRVPNAKSVGAVGLIILLPLAFFSDVFVVERPDVDAAPSARSSHCCTSSGC